MERYSLQKVIGEGSFGRALLVRCTISQQKYVVKEIQLPKVFANKECDAPVMCWTAAKAITSGKNHIGINVVN